MWQEPLVPAAPTLNLGHLQVAPAALEQAMQIEGAASSTERVRLWKQAVMAQPGMKCASAEVTSAGTLFGIYYIVIDNL